MTLMMARRFAVILAACLVSAPVPAADLLSSFALAERNDPEYRSTLASRDATRELRPQARANLWLPVVQLSAETIQNWQTIESTLQFGGTGSSSPEFNSRQYQLNVRQPVYHYDRWVALKQADLAISQADTEVGAALQALIIRVAERYFDVLAAEDNLEFAAAEKNALQRQLDQARQRFEVGLIAITDVQEAQAGYDLAVALEIQAINALDNAREALREVTGQYQEDVARLGTDMPLIQPDPADIDEWTQTALNQNLSLQAARQAADRAMEEIRLQYSGHLPSLDLVGGYGSSITGGRFGDTEIDAGSIGLQMTLPIYEGGRVSSRTRQAEHLHRESLERLEQARRSAQRQSRDAYLGVISGISQVQALNQAVVSNQSALEATEAGFEVGTRTAVDVVTSQQALSRAQRDFARARYDYVLNLLRLKQAAGTLAPEDVALVNDWLVR